MGNRALTSNVVFHSKTKHIEIDVHFIKEWTIVRVLEIQYVPTEFPVANILTKPLSITRFLMLTKRSIVGSYRNDHISNSNATKEGTK